MLFYASQKILALAKNTPLEGVLSPLRLFTYITFRSAGAAVTALLLSWWLGPYCIVWLKRLKLGQDYQDRAWKAAGFRPASSASAARRPWAG